MLKNCAAILSHYMKLIEDNLQKKKKNDQKEQLHSKKRTQTKKEQH